MIIDLDGELPADVHRDPPPHIRRIIYQSRNFETGIKVVDLLAPYIKGGKIGLSGGAGVGKQY